MNSLPQENLSFVAALNKAACVIAFAVCLFQGAYAFATLFWILWGVILVIEKAVDVIGAHLDNIQR